MTHTQRDGSADGERRRDDAHALLAKYREAYVRRCRRVLLAALLERGTATMDDVRSVVTLPDGIDPVCVGPVPGELARAGIIERVGYVPSTRADAHARPLSLWRLRDRAAAACWLAEHPDIPNTNEKAQRWLPLGDSSDGRA